MIIQLPPGTTSVTLRFDGPGHTGDVTLMPGLAMLPPPAYPPQAKPGPRRMVAFACAAFGTLAVGAGLSLWNRAPRAEAMLNLPRVARWSGDAPQVPAALQAELDRAPTVIPPSGMVGTSAPPPRPTDAAATPAPAAGANPFGLE
jgi:hypothetical protein